VHSQPGIDAPLVLSLPKPCLVVLVGAAGSGKTTLAARLFAPDQVLSSDAYRSLVAGDAGDQSMNRVVFRRLHRDLSRRLGAGLTTVVDATNVTSYARRALTRIAARQGVPAVAIVLDLPPDLVLARNATRTGRIVPEGAVRQQLAQLAHSLARADLAAEGFATVHRLTERFRLDDGLVT
jgi:protein phosphatase